MDAFIETANHLANQWSGAIWTIVWQSTVLAGIVFLVTLCLRRASAAVRFWLWMLVPLRLLVMPLITISLPLLPAVMQSENVNTESVSTEMVLAEPAVIRTFEATDFAYEFDPIIMPFERSKVVVTRIWPNVWALLMGAWLVGITFWAIRFFLGWRKIKHITRSASQVGQERVLGLAQEAAKIVGLKRVPKIMVTYESVSPFLFGIFRPVLVVPAGLVGGVCDEGLLAVIAHEFAHLRRRDTIVGWILTICEVIYFFHPVFHFVKRRILFERELACDDWVVAAGNSRRSIYANALINAADICRGFSAKIGPVGAVAESFGDLKKRLIAISSNLKPKTRLSKIALVLLILIGTICVPGFVLTNRSNASSEQISDNATLELVREMVVRNEALINPIKMDYTVKPSRTGERQLPVATGGSRRISGRSFSHSNCIWAQDGEKHFARIDRFYDINEPARSNVYVFDDKITTRGGMPDLMEGAISAIDTHDWYNMMVAKLGLRPFEGEHRLSEILVSEYASLHDKIEIFNGREAYIVDVRRPPYHAYFARIWIDKQRGMPLRIWYYEKHPAWGDEKSTSQINDIELYQLPNGAWIPVKGVRTLIRSNYISYEHISVDVNSITTRSEDIPQSQFEVNFPDGARISNSITGLTYVKGQSFKTYEQIVEGGGSFIAGTVVDVNGVPVPEVVVSPLAVRTQQSIRLIQSHERNCAVTDSKGRFAVELEQEGLYELYFYPKNFADTNVRRIPLGEHNLKVTLNKGGTITGHVVRIAEGRKVPVANVDVTIQDQGIPRASLKTGQPIKTTTDVQGRFKIRYLSTELTRRPDNQYRARSWQIKCGPTSENIIFDEGTNTREVELVLRLDPSTVAPLTGKKLPGLDGIKINLNPDQTQDKMMLLCFFDMNQRPARNCIIQLNKQAEQLKQQGVAVIGIQAAEADTEDFNQWLETSDFNFPIGIIQGDPDEIKFNWRVKSLPWLILTDKQHIVTAEGFSINEVGEKLQ